MEALILAGLQLIGGLFNDFQTAAEARDEAALERFRDKLEQTRAEIAGEIRAQFEEPPDQPTEAPGDTPE